jgi:hypothetical protein
MMPYGFFSVSGRSLSFLVSRKCQIRKHAIHVTIATRPIRDATGLPPSILGSQSPRPLPVLTKLPFIFPTFSSSPKRDFRLSGKFANGHVAVTKGFNFEKTCLREAGTKPFRVSRDIHPSISVVVADDEGIEPMRTRKITDDDEPCPRLTRCFIQAPVLLPGSYKLSFLLPTMPSSFCSRTTRSNSTGSAST